MRKPHICVSESFLRSAVRYVVFLQVIDPERNRSLRHGVCRRLNLSRTLSAGYALVRKRRHHRARLGIRVCVVQVVVCVATVKQNRLLDESLSDYLRKKVDIFLCPAGTHRNVVYACNRVVHSLKTSSKITSRILFSHPIADCGPDGRAMPSACRDLIYWRSRNCTWHNFRQVQQAPSSMSKFRFVWIALASSVLAAPLAAQMDFSGNWGD